MALVHRKRDTDPKTITIDNQTIDTIAALLQKSLIQVSIDHPLDFDSGLTTTKISTTHLKVLYVEKYGENAGRSQCINLRLWDDYIELNACKLHDFSAKSDQSENEHIEMVLDDENEMIVGVEYLWWINYQNNHKNGAKVSVDSDDDGPHLIVAMDIFAGESVPTDLFLEQFTRFFVIMPLIIQEFEEAFCSE